MLPLKCTTIICPGVTTGLFTVFMLIFKGSALKAFKLLNTKKSCYGAARSIKKTSYAFILRFMLKVDVSNVACNLEVPGSNTSRTGYLSSWL